MIFDDPNWGSTISFEPNIPVSLDGTLELKIADEIDPCTLVGSTFQLFDWTGVTSTGTFTSIVSQPGLLWNTSELYTTGCVTLRADLNSSLEVPLKVTPHTLNLGSHDKWLKAYLKLPSEVLWENVDPCQPITIEPLDIKSDQVKISTDGQGHVCLVASFDCREFCDLIKRGPDEIVFMGWLTNGKAYYSKAQIRIITPGLPEMVEFASHWLQTDCRKPYWCDGKDLNQDAVVNLIDFAVFQEGYIEINTNGK